MVLTQSVQWASHRKGFQLPPPSPLKQKGHHGDIPGNHWRRWRQASTSMLQRLHWITELSTWQPFGLYMCAHFCYKMVHCEMWDVFLLWHITLQAITGTITSAPYHFINSSPFIWRSGTSRFYLLVPYLQVSCSKSPRVGYHFCCPHMATR